MAQSLFVLSALLIAFTGATQAIGGELPVANASSSLASGVMVGGDAGLDACGGSGVVLATTTLIRMTPEGFKFDETVPVGTTVFACDSMTDAMGEYVGIVFSENRQDCGVSSPIASKREYVGPCRSGWIKKEFFYLIAG